MAAEPRTLDIAEKQVLVDFWEDEGQFYWHHRILLLATDTPGRWIWATPDYEVSVAELATHRIVPLQRNEIFPVDYRGYIYAFDTADATEARVEVMRRQARQLAEIMNGGPVGPPIPDGATWRIADTAHASFGLEIPAAVIGTGEHFITRGKAGCFRARRRG